MNVTPETLTLCLCLLRREKQRIKEMPVDPIPGLDDERRLIVLDEAAEEIKQALGIGLNYERT